MMSAVVPDGRMPIRNLTQEYVRKRFSGAYNADDEFNSLAEWQQLRPLLLRQTIMKRLRRWQNQFLRQK